jgi:alkylation response protein AidB-like acyl-CoA dehydrogenase
VPKHQGISCVIVPTNSPGLKIQPIKRMTGIADFNECFFDDVRVPLENVVGDINNGWRVMRTTLGHEHMTNFLGVQFKQAVTVQLVVDRLRRYEATGAPISHGLRKRVAQAWINTQLLRLHGMRNVVKLAEGREPGAEGSIVKVFGQEEEKRLWELAVDVLGAGGLTQDLWTTGFLSTRGSTLGGGTSEIHRNKVAERVLGMPRDLWADDNEGGEADGGGDD